MTKHIKTKETSHAPKVKDLSLRMPKELTKTVAVKSHEGIGRISDAGNAASQSESPYEYGGNKVTEASEQAADKARMAATAAGRKAVRTASEKQKERKREAADRAFTEHARTTESDPVGTSSRNAANAPASGGQKEAVKTAGKEARTTGKEAPSGKRSIRTREVVRGEVKTASKASVRENTKEVKGMTGKARVKSSTGTQAKIAGGKKLSIQRAKKLAEQTRRTAVAAKSTAKNSARGIRAAVEAIKSTAHALLATAMAGGSAMILILVIVAGIIGGAWALGSSGGSASESVSQEVLAYTSTIQRYATQYGIGEYTSVIQAIMMQESGGRGTDPMQASECPYNTRYPNSPNAIQDADYSIQVGIQYYADCLREANCQSPNDMDRLKLSLQGYNYGNGYISWAIRNHGGYSEANALQFSQEQAASHGWARYGDPEYVPHVLRYYASSPFAGLFGYFGGNGEIVEIARSQLGNAGGQKFWSWYGFGSRVAWCACFVSWCGDQAGLIESGAMPRFSLCSEGIAWFQARNRWQGRNHTPTTGTLIFFDWDGDGTCDHVGLVDRSEGGMVYTIEGNSGDAVREQSYAVGSSSIVGYGLITE